MKILTLEACADKRGTDAGYQRHRAAREQACTECQSANMARLSAWKNANPDRFSKSHRNSTLKRKYGITLEDYDKLLEIQDGRCAICNRASAGDGRSLAVDHDHATGRVRGLLCTDCNVALGKMGDDADRLRGAAWYLEESSKS